MKPERWQHIDKLLSAALELEAGQRAAFVDQACAADEELRRKIEALLAAHEQAESFIEAPAFAGIAQSLADEARSMVGKELGHYLVSDLIGAGGMGAVWKAKDTRLGREVAIKTLPAEFGRHADRLARFEREAKLLASLNHPNIAAIHGLDEDRGTRFLVLELVEGETLADRLLRGAIPLEESLQLARQISEALEAAHEKGIIHRDLKPANIKITDDGKVKVLDFGLAKAFAPDDVNTDPSDWPSLSIESTEHGMILGTSAYMAPEQARGKRVDRRADIWAFGVVSYEMVTGTRLFQGTDSTETMASVVTKEPDFGKAPARVRRLLRKCLEKDPKNRLRDIGDAWELLNDPSVAADAPHTQAGARRKLAPPVALVLAIVVALVFAFRWSKPLPWPKVARFQIYAPPGGQLPLGTPAISKDGRTLAYTVVEPDGVTRVYVRAIDSVETRALPGTERAVHPFWSPGGASLAFASGRRLKRIDLGGGSIHDLIDISFPWQVAWNQNDDILLRAPGHELLRISSQGGAPTVIPNSSGYAFPTFLSDGQRFLALVINDNGSSIQLSALGSAERTLVVDNVESAPVLAPTPRGKTYLLLLSESDLTAQEFNEASGKVLGNPVVLVPNIGRVANPAVRPAVGVSPSGILAYQSANQVTTRRLRWVSRSGVQVRTFSPEVSLEEPRVSPDQSWVVGKRSPDGGNIWVTDLVRETSERKTFDLALENSAAVWSKDGTRLAFLRARSGIYAIDVNGGGKPELLTDKEGFPTSWSGQHLLYGSNSKIYLLDVAGGKKPIQVGSPSGGSFRGEFSPDGHYIAFHTNRSGRPEVYVQPIPPGTGEKLVSI